MGGGVDTQVASAGKIFKIRMLYKTRQFYFSSKKVKAAKSFASPVVPKTKIVNIKINLWFLSGFTDGGGGNRVLFN